MERRAERFFSYLAIFCIFVLDMLMRFVKKRTRDPCTRDNGTKSPFLPLGFLLLNKYKESLFAISKFGVCHLTDNFSVLQPCYNRE